MAKSSPRWRTWLNIALMFLEGALVGWVVATYGAEILESWVEQIGARGMAIAIILIIGLYYLAVATHEVGHLVAGKLVGFKFLFLLLGPILFDRQAQGFAFKLVPTFVLGGMAGSFPTDTHRLTRRMAIMVAAGPLASFILAMLAGGTWWWTQGLEANSAFTIHLDWIRFTLGFLAIASMSLFMLSILPYRTEGLQSDGFRLWAAIRSGPHIRHENAILAINGESMTGQRPRHWTSAWIEDLLSADNDHYQGIGHWYGFYQSLDHHHLDLAERHLEAALATISKLAAIQRSALMYEAAFFYAFYKQDLETARTWFQKAKPNAFSSNVHLRAHAALQLLDGQPDEALKMSRRALKLLKRSLDQGMLIAEWEWIEKIQACAQRKVSQLSSNP